MSDDCPMVTNPELEAVIHDSPDNADAYLVYGDWLQSQGEMLGELVSIQHALGPSRSDASLRESEALLMKNNAEYFFGPNQPDPEDPDAVNTPAYSEAAWVYGFTQSVWRDGFVHSLVFDTGYWGEEELFGKDAGKILTAFLARPGSQFIQRISVGEIWDEDCEDDDYEGPITTHAVDAIVASPCATMLKEFAVTGGEHDISGVSLDVSKLWDSCPNLEVVGLYAGQLTMGEIVAPKLRCFVAHTGGLGAAELKAVAKATWPALEELEIWFGAEEYGCDCSFSDLEPLLQRTDLKLKKLGIMNMEFGDEVCTGILRSPLLAGLEHLDLSMGVIGEEGAKAIIDNAEKLSHLSSFRIAGFWGPDVATALKAICEDAVVETRGPAHDNYRYVEVGE